MLTKLLVLSQYSKILQRYYLFFMYKIACDFLVNTMNQELVSNNQGWARWTVNGKTCFKKTGER